MQLNRETSLFQAPRILRSDEQMAKQASRDQVFCVAGSAVLSCPIPCSCNTFSHASQGGGHAIGTAVWHDNVIPTKKVGLGSH